LKVFCKPCGKYVDGLDKLEKPKPIREVLGFDPDYSLSCVVTGSCACRGSSQVCGSLAQCLGVNTCGCSCPSPTVPHSHYVSNTCVSGRTHNCACNRAIGQCYDGRTCRCDCTGLCYYACDDGYVWNPVTLTCDLVAVVAVPLMDGFVFVQ